MTGHLDAGGVSRQLLLCRISATNSFIQVRRCRLKTHAEDDVRVIQEAHADNLDGHPTPFVLTLRYVGKSSAFDFHGTFRTVRDVHRLWDHPMSAARFAKLVEQLQSFPIRDSVILETLQLLLAFRQEGGKRGKIYLIHFANTPLDFWL
jgi:hypothetical protein